MQRLFKSTRVVSAMTMISRVFGLLRDVIFARFFGASMDFDIFIVAFRIPNFLRRVFAEGGFSLAFVPILSEYKEQRGEQKVKALIDQTAATLGLVLILVTIIGIIAAPVLIWVFAPGFAGDVSKQELTANLLRITFPYLLFISLTAFAGGILNTYKRFAVPSFTPVLSNLSLIFSAVWLAPYFSEPTEALAWGVFFAGVIQLLFQLPFLRQIGLLPVPRFGRDKEGVSRILKLMLPTLFAVSITQINLLVDTVIASFLQTGSISWLYYSDRMVELPIGVFGVALSTVILPNLSSEHAKGSSETYCEIMTWAIRLVILISLPAAIGLALLSAPILTTLFQYEEFTSRDVMMSSYSLMAYSVGLPGFILIKVFSSGFFSRQDTKTPVKIGVIAMLSNIILNLVLVGPLEHVGLALATSLSAYINAGLLYLYLKRDGLYRSGQVWSGYLLKVATGIIVMAILLIGLVPDAAGWIKWGVFDRVFQLTIWVLSGVLVYFATLRLVGFRASELSPPK